MPEKYFRLAEGCEAADLAGVHEAYSVERSNNKHVFTVNVSIERLSDVFAELVGTLGEPLFFALEAGTPRDEEEKLRTRDSDPFHKDVYYLDNLSLEKANGLGCGSFPRRSSHDLTSRSV